MKNIRHNALCVDSLEKADFFYRNLLGLKYVDSKRETGEYIKSLLGLDSLTWVKLATDSNDILELYWLPNKNNKSFNHIAFTVDNITRLRNKLIEYEITCSDIKIDDSKKHKVMFVRDPDLNLLEIVEEINE